ncbi:hypothetical protein [Streptomyces endophytica]|uniref:hypothetical protein n=1 Tax=Streptomyces endophytica TaxID=2991496 RepID=UPI00311B256C
MHRLLHRHLGKAVAGAALALTGTAAMAAVTLPAGAGATGTTATPPAAAGAPAPGRDPGAPPPGVVEPAGTQGARGHGRDPLTDDELRRARDLAQPRALRNAARNVTGRPGPNRSSPIWPNAGPRKPGWPTRRAAPWSRSTTTRPTATSPRRST